MELSNIINLFSVFILTACLMSCSSQNIVSAEEILCERKGASIHVTMTRPHPKFAIIYRPDGSTVWMQSDSNHHAAIKDFSKLKHWVLNSSSQGTVWQQGTASVQAVFQESGKYHLYIADNLETEKENTAYIECIFDWGN